MEVNANLAQDVFKDAGESVIFVMLSLKREDIEKEREIIGAEDPEFINGSYAFAQKYVHDLDAWRALPTEVQEKYVGRRKYSDLELSDEEKDPRAHNIISQDNRDGEEHKIVRMNVVFANPGEGGAAPISLATHVTGTLRAKWSSICSRRMTVCLSIRQPKRGNSSSFRRRNSSDVSLRENCSEYIGIPSVYTWECGIRQETMWYNTILGGEGH